MLSHNRQSNFLKTLYIASSLIVFTYFATGMGMLIKGLHGLPLLLLLVFIFLLPVLIKESQIKITKDDTFFIATLVVFYLGFLLLDLMHNEDLYHHHIRFVVAALATYALIKTPLRIEVFWLGVALGAIATLAWAIYTVFFLGQARADTERFDAILFGSGAITLAYISAAGIFWAQGLNKNKFVWITLLSFATIAGVTASLLSGSRGVWLSLLPVTILFFVFHTKYFNLGLKKTIIFYMALVVISIFFMWITGLISILENRLIVASNEIDLYSTEANKDTSVGMRLEMWKVSILAFKEAPLIGLGKEGYYLFQSDLINNGIVTSEIADFKQVHNGYLNVLSKSGLIGLLIYISLLISLLYLFFKKMQISDTLIKSLSLAAITIIISHLVFSLTDTYLFRPRVIMNFIFPLAFIWALISNKELELKNNA